MSRIALVLSALLSICSLSAAQTPGCPDPRTVAPGQLNLPLLVTDHAGTHWQSGPVTSGVALPPGLVTDLSRLRIVDAAGNTVAAQFDVMERWWTRPDRSVRWLLVDLQTDVFDGETTTLYLRDDAKSPAPATPLKVTQDDQAITVVTGPLKFVVSKKAFNLFDSAWFDQNGDGKFSDDEQYVKPSADNGSVIVAGEWKEQGIAAGATFTSAAAPPRQVVVEQAGPVRATLLIDGTHAQAGAGEGKPFYDYRVRITAYAGKPYVRVGYSISNIRTAEQQYVWPIAEAKLVTRLEADGEIAAVFLTDNNHFVNPPFFWPGQGQNFAAESKASMMGARCSDAKVLMLQDSSGGDEWQQLEPNGHARRIFGGDRVPGVQFRGWKCWRGGQEVFSGRRSPGLVDIRHNDNDPAKERGIVVVMTDFWQNYPKAFEADGGQIALKVFPAEAKQQFDLVPGTRKTHEVMFYFHGPRLYERHYDWLWGRATHPLMARPPADWTCRIDGAWDLGLSNVACVPPSGFDRSVLDGSRVGWGNFGWISPWNPGGQHWNEATQFAAWLLRGDYRAFEEAAITSRWAGDLVPVHYETDDMDRYWMLMRGWNRRESKVPLISPPDWKDRRSWIGYPDSGHMGMVMWLEHYRLTGDGFARDSVLHSGAWGRAYAWGSNHDSKPPFRINWCRKRDPDADPSYRNTNRYQAWPLFNFLQGYSVNGDAQWLAEARTICLGYRNAMRANAVGYICDYINNAGTADVYGKDYKPEVRKTAASTAYANFQLGLVVNALAKYYVEDRDEDVRDTILGSVDVLVNRSLLHDAQGKPAGWAYCYGDIWGPNGKAPGDWNPDVLQAVGYGYRVSGRADFLDVLKVGYEATKANWCKFDNAAWTGVVHPRDDQQPPAAVTDLAARLDGGKVALTWTAPAGEPVDYQVKYAPAEIVERVTNWPPRGAPLPQTRDEYLKLTGESLARQVSFYQAFNVRGEPTPAKAGAKESFTLTLPAGTYWFALRTLDAADNQSAMSNVVKLVVPGAGQ